MTFLGGVYTGAVAGLLSLCVTVLVDSRLWGYWVWPEGAVLFFNTALNKSSEWGVSPWHWYVTSALPRAMHFLSPLVLVAWAGVRLPSKGEWKSHIDGWRSTSPSLSQYLRRLMSMIHLSLKGDGGTIVYYSTPAVLYIVLYSFLAHKELRFILPVLPVLLLSAACGLDRLWVSDPFKEDSSPSSIKMGVDTQISFHILRYMHYGARYTI